MQKRRGGAQLWATQTGVGDSGVQWKLSPHLWDPGVQGGTMKTIFLTINLCFCTGRPSSLKPMAHITPALRTPSSQLLPFFFPTCASKETSVYLIMILISLLVPPRVKKIVPPLFQMWGVQKNFFRSLRSWITFCPPTFKTVAPPLDISLCYAASFRCCGSE